MMFIFTDIETTGLNAYTDDILALGIILTRDDFTEVARKEWEVHLGKDLSNMRHEVIEMHTASGLFGRCWRSKLTVDEVQTDAIAFIQKHCIAAAPMAGNSIHFDRAFLKVCMPELEKTYHYRNFDVSTLRLLCHATVPGAKDWKSARPKAHTPIADLENSLEELAHWREVLRGRESESLLRHEIAKLAFELAEEKERAQSLLSELEGCDRGAP